MGYSLHFSTSTYLAYSNDVIDLDWPWPLIMCKVDPNDCNHRITVDLAAGGNIELMQITIKGLSFEHPYVKDFIVCNRFFHTDNRNYMCINQSECGIKNGLFIGYN